MKIIILGAGGWGALVGAYLARAGAQVTLLFRRQAHVDAIHENGGCLLIEKPQGSQMVQVSATTDPAELRETDLVIVAVKNRDSAAALQSIRHVELKAIATVQNGLGHAEKLKQAFPQADVIRIISRVAGALLDYGRVQRGDDDFPTWIGDAYQGITPFVRELTDLFKAAGLPCEASQDIEGIEWSKVTWWTPSSIAAVMTRLPQTEVMQSPDFAHLMVMITRDMVRVAQACGVEIRDYPTIEVMERCRGSVAEGVAAVMRQGCEWEERGGKGYKQAMLLDIERGRKTEIEDTAGAIWQLAKEKGIEVPYLEAGYFLVRGLEARFP